MKLPVHHEWFRPISATKCPHCKAGTKSNPANVWSWGEYQYGKWRTVHHFCEACFHTSVQAPLLTHVKQCGYTITLVGYGGLKLPDWLTLNKEASC